MKLAFISHTSLDKAGDRIRNQSNETRKAEQRKQRGLWQRRHRLNIVERDTFMQLNKKYGTYTGPKQ